MEKATSYPRHNIWYVRYIRTWLTHLVRDSSYKEVREICNGMATKQIGVVYERREYAMPEPRFNIR